MALGRHRGHIFFLQLCQFNKVKRIKLEWEHCMRQLLKVDLDEQTRNCSSYIIFPIRTELILPIPVSPCLLKSDSALFSTGVGRFRKRFGKCLDH